MTRGFTAPLSNAAVYHAAQSVAQGHAPTVVRCALCGARTPPRHNNQTGFARYCTPSHASVASRLRARGVAVDGTWVSPRRA